MNDEYQIAAQKYRAALPPGECVEFALDGADRLDVPCHSVIFYPQDGPHKGGIGYGATREIARCGAYGELSEDFWAHQALEDWPRVAASYREMLGKYGGRAVLDPRTLCLEAGTLYTPEIALEWVQIERLGPTQNGSESNSQSAKVWVPIEFVACGWSDLKTAGNPALGATRRGRLVTPITNGLGAGLERDQAILHSVLELLQRDGNGLSIRALATTTALDLASVDDPQCVELLQKFETAGIDVVVKVASLDFGLTGFYVSGLDRAPTDGGASGVMALAGGEAVHPIAVVGLRKALLEWAASRSRVAFFHGPLAIAERLAPPGYLDGFRANFRPGDEEPRTLQSMAAWSKLGLDEVRALMLARVHRVEKWVKFADLPTYAGADTSKGTLLDFVAAQLRAAGLEIFVADFSDAASGVCAVKVIVPGLEVETLSYGRIGARNLARLMKIAGAGGPVVAGIGAAPDGALPIQLPDAAQPSDGAAWFDTAAASAVVGEFFALYREPGRHAVALLAELESASR